MKGTLAQETFDQGQALASWLEGDSTAKNHARAIEPHAPARRFYGIQYSGPMYASATDESLTAIRLCKFIQDYGLAHKRVLEVGCGRGRFQHLVPNWFGIDLAEEAGREVRKPFAAATATALPFKGFSFDVVWSIHALEHVAGAEGALAEILRVLKPGGLAYLDPAWQCRPWAAGGYAVRPYSDFGFLGKLIKASIPLRDSVIFRALRLFPLRVSREVVWALFHRPTKLRYRRLRPNYEIFWCSDSDACNSIDPHEVALWFRTRGCSIENYATRFRQLFIRNGAIIIRKSGIAASEIGWAGGEAVSAAPGESTR